MRLHAKIVRNFSVIDTDRKTNIIYQYDENASQWKKVGKIDRIREYSAVSCIDNVIYVTGGKK